MNTCNAPDEVLYNGIRLPKEWPPKTVNGESRDPKSIPYLTNPPSVIEIDIGRQLFVDDFLIEETTLKRTFNKPIWHEHNPILEPVTALEMNEGICPVACPFNDGVFYDPREKCFKMWYHAGWFDGIGYAVSEDGLHWERVNLDVETGTNRVLPVRPGFKRDGVGIWLDHDAENPDQRFKMFAYFRSPEWEGGEVYTSPDGLHWGNPTRTGPCGDNTTFFYNPFQKKWVYSIRTALNSPWKNYRVRSYREHDNFIAGADWNKKDVVLWATADDLDPPHPVYQCQTQLYNIDAVAYESLMLGLFQIHLGPQNEVCDKGGFPKITDLMIGFSRDGFHFDRTNREPFLACSHQEGTWNRAYLHSAGGCCLVVGDKLYFYVGGFSGKSPKLGGNIYAGGSTGLATLRRDGFASMDAGSVSGVLTTRLVRFSGRYLFVNLNTEFGNLQVEVLDENNRIIDGFSKERCLPIRTDKTTQQVNWINKDDLSSFANKPVKFRFYLTGGEFYSFWVSPDSSGASYGYIAAGGPEFTGPVDTIGQNRER